MGHALHEYAEAVLDVLVAVNTMFLIAAHRRHGRTDVRVETTDADDSPRP